MIVSKLVTRMTSLRLFKIDNRFFCLQVHNSASKGFTKEGAQLYESGRPSYTDESIEKIINIAKLKFSNSNIVLELGAGTGKFTSSFLALSKKYNILPNMRYIATEPSDGFRKRIEDKYSNSDYSGSLEVMKGLGSCIPAVSKSLDCGTPNNLKHIIINFFQFPFSYHFSQLSQHRHSTGWRQKAR